MNSNSYSALPSDEVRRLATACLERVAALRERAQKDIVEQERQRVKNSLRYRFFGRVMPSDADLYEQSDSDEKFFAAIRGHGSEDVANKLLKLAASTKGDVFVTAEDLEMIT